MHSWTRGGCPGVSSQGQSEGFRIHRVKWGGAAWNCLEGRRGRRGKRGRESLLETPTDPFLTCLLC